MHKRKFLAGLFSTGMLLPLSYQFGQQIWAAQASQAPANPNPKRLIVVFLRGAVDGLSVVVPYSDRNYYQARPTIAIPRPGSTNGGLDLDGNFALHPALSSLLPLWQQKSLAFIHACGSPADNRSHFEAQDQMETANLSPQSTTDGWMNRLLALLPNRNPVQALNLGSVTPRILRGQLAVASLPSGRNSTSRIGLDNPQVAQYFDRLYANNLHNANSPRDNTLTQAYQEGRQARQEIRNALEAEMQAANNGAPLSNGFASDAQRLGRLMVRDSSIQLAFVALGGWDTHVNQGSSQGQLATRLKGLGDGLASLVQSLGDVYQDTAIVVISEFGRTVKENGNGGTDHGHGNVFWLLGGGVQGGKVTGQFPGLAPSQLYQNRDLAVTTDFRELLSQVLQKHLSLNTAEIAQVFPSYQPVGSGLSLF